MEMYHAVFALPNGQMSYNLNLSKESCVENLLIPYVNNQCILETFTDIEGHALMNIGGAIFLLVLKTDKKLESKEFSSKNPSSIIKAIEQQNISVEICTRELLAFTDIDLKNNRALRGKLKTNKTQVFVVMKFDDEVLNSAYESIKSTLNELKLDTVRIDEIEHSGAITDEILRYIDESKYVLVELTGSRPNCYYEAGYADALGKEIIYVIKDGEDIHFDLKHRKFIIWKTESDLRKKIRNRFKSLLDESHGFSTKV